MESLRIVVPSRKRVNNMRRLLGLIPEALVCVAREELSAYAQAVPKRQLLGHDVSGGLPAIRDWINETIQEDCLVMIDDDLQCVRALTKPRGNRRITDPVVLGQIIENSARVAADLDIGVFCWTRTMNRLLLDPLVIPFKPVQPMSSSFGLRGPARQRRFDSGLLARADVDFTMRTLRDDRLLLCDCRFYFDHGRIFSGSGGQVGLVDSASFDAATKELERRWGKFLSLKPPNYSKTGRYVAACGIRVIRCNPLCKE